MREHIDALAARLDESRAGLGTNKERLRAALAPLSALAAKQER